MSNEMEKEMSFEQAMSRLEQIVNALDGGKVSLDESLKLYEEGIALVRLCSNRLDSAEQKIKIIRTTENNSKIEEDFTE